MATFNFYVLPADQCLKALELYRAAEDSALKAKRELLAKFGADAILRAGEKVEALGWLKAPPSMHGFTLPKFDGKQGLWLQRPLRNTLRGKQAAAEMAYVGLLLETWQWALEEALGVRGYVFGRYHGSLVFLYAAAKPLSDGRVMLRLPVRDARDPDRGSGVAIQAPAFAIEISQAEAEKLVGEPISNLA